MDKITLTDAQGRTSVFPAGPDGKAIVPPDMRERFGLPPAAAAADRPTLHKPRLTASHKARIARAQAAAGGKSKRT